MISNLEAGTVNEISWSSWGDQVFARALAQEKLVFLYIGYQSCPLSEVMERECSSTPELLSLLNTNFVAMRVDRDESPELSTYYMTMLQAMNGENAWPICMFLTPQGDAVYGGSSFWGESNRQGPSFKEVLEAIVLIWDRDRGNVIKQSRLLSQHCRNELQGRVHAQPISRNLVDSALELIHAHRDPVNGGFYQAPKFAQLPYLHLYCYAASRGRLSTEQAEHLQTSLEAMRRGALFDPKTGLFYAACHSANWQDPYPEIVLGEQIGLQRLYAKAGKLFAMQDWQQLSDELRAKIKQLFPPNISLRSFLYRRNGKLQLRTVRPREDLLETWVERLACAIDRGDLKAANNFVTHIVGNFWSEDMAAFTMLSSERKDRFTITNIWDNNSAAPLGKLVANLLSFVEKAPSQRLAEILDLFFIRFSGALAECPHAYASLIPAWDRWLELKKSLISSRG